jgi:hypothetical protein
VKKTHFRKRYHCCDDGMFATNFYIFKFTHSECLQIDKRDSKYRVRDNPESCWERIKNNWES